MSKSRLKKLIKKKQNEPSESEKSTPSPKSSAKPTLQTRTRRKRPATSERTSSEATPRREPRVHAAPPRIHAAPTPVEEVVQTNTEEVANVESTTLAESTEVSTSGQEGSTPQTLEEAVVEQTVEVVSEVATPETSVVDDATTNTNGPRVHAAPPSAFVKNDANSGLGSAVIAPPPNYGTGGPSSDTPSSSRKNEKGRSNWSDKDEDAKKGRNKTRRTSRRGRQRDWTMDSFGDGTGQPRHQRNQMRRKKGKTKA